MTILRGMDAAHARLGAEHRPSDEGQRCGGENDRHEPARDLIGETLVFSPDA
jgi:hypothetical protein